MSVYAKTRVLFTKIINHNFLGVNNDKGLHPNLLKII